MIGYHLTWQELCNLFLSVSQCLARGRHSGSRLLLSGWWEGLCALVPEGWGDFSLGSVKWQAPFSACSVIKFLTQTLN